MKKFLIVGFAAAALFGAPANAAEMPLKAEVLFNWTGWYLGGNGGYSWGKSRETATSTAATTVDSIRHRGGEASGEGGYCWQSPGARTVTCLELRYDFPRERGRGSIDIPGGTVEAQPVADPFLLGPHFGFLTDLNRTLWYVAGGLAMGEVGGKSTVTDGVTSGFTNGTKWQAGWFLGAGVERMLDQHWSVKLEYDYVRIGSGNGDVQTVNPPQVRYFPGGTIALGGKAYDNVISAGINYHFGTH